MNRSPWLAQLRKQRDRSPLSKHLEADIVIVGGGISGLATAYFVLTHTKRKVVLIEAARIAHGATGHNAGQLVTYFERPFYDIAREFGLTMAAEGQAGVESAWLLLEEMRHTTKIQTPVHLFVGYAAIGSFELLLHHLETSRLRKEAGLLIERMRIANIPSLLAKIPKHYSGLYSAIPHADVMSLLETQDTTYIAALSAQKGVMNSAHFTEELAVTLLTQYPDRFSVYEESPIATIALGHTGATLHCREYHVKAQEVILCTNGFEHFDITDEQGAPVDRRFHEEVYGTIGYMAGYLAPLNAPPIAISYREPTSTHPADPYYYVTRRPYDGEDGEKHNLICAGGPEEELPEKKFYQRAMPFPESATKDILAFLNRTLPSAPKRADGLTFSWHGLMGYTRNGLRLIGRDPCSSQLLYNLGCNGIGILPAIYGGKKLSEILAGIQQKRSIFDPFHGVCDLPAHTKHSP